MVKLPKQAGVRVKISLKPNKKASYTAYQNIDTRLGYGGHARLLARLSFGYVLL